MTEAKRAIMVAFENLCHDLEEILGKEVPGIKLDAVFSLTVGDFNLESLTLTSQLTTPCG